MIRPIIIVAAFFALTACNTVEGMGRDVSAAGNSMSDTADDVKGKM
ncbi:entericidin A/B family lipoprotein [Amaricoccus macauensis]